MAAPLLSVGEAAACLRRGEVVAYPTEAVFGLGCDPENEAAVSTILSLKNRPVAAGLILISDSYERLRPYVLETSGEVLEQALSSWPGPLTWLFPKSARAPRWISGEHETIAVRVTAHPVCRALCAAFEGAVVSTSANPSSAPPARTAEAVADYFGEGLCGIVEGAVGGATSPSEIRDLLSGRIIRPGQTAES
jgi:L-threonylcarbamoyladenylate synthase